MSTRIAASPPGLPVIDVDPFDQAFLADPTRFHPQLRDGGPVVWLSALGIYGMARYAEVKAALKDWQTFCSGRGVGLLDFAKEEPWRPPSLLIEADPPLHDRTRKIMSQIISLPALKVLRAQWQVIADKLVDRLIAQGGGDAVAELAEAFPLAVFPSTIGLRHEGRQHLLPYAAAVFNAFGPRNALQRETAAAAITATAWVNESCERRYLSPGGWGAAVYAAADRGECSEMEAARLVRSLLTAGLDTTINSMGNMLQAFIQHPSEWERLRADPALTRRAFDESLRWSSTVQTFFRTTTRDVEVAGKLIPEGSKVLLFLAAANRDPRFWNDPHRFDITRAASGHVGFGFGIHQCLGQMMARQEAEVLLAALVPRAVRIRANGEPIWRLNNTLRALASLPVRMDPN